MKDYYVLSKQVCYGPETFILFTMLEFCLGIMTKVGLTTCTILSVLSALNCRQIASLIYCTELSLLYLLLASNNDAPILVWHGGDMCCLVIYYNISFWVHKISRSCK